MSWEVASLALIALVLVAGFGWYERSQPSAKVLALVATLAALAAISRIAFAPLPNVKPMTDIVLLAGFALGGPAGFAVGAVGALASNVVFGQGPWTPWQMGAWGAVGVFGAALRPLLGPLPGRWALAAACAVAGAFHGLVMDVSTWATLSGQQTLGQLVVISGRSLPFNLAHVVGNVAFCLAFGLAFLRVLERLRARLDVRWEPVRPPSPDPLHHPLA